MGFLALHGGLEQGTAEIATDAAARCGASIYAVVQPADLRWHIPSALYDPDHSDDLARFLTHVDVVVSVHGFGGLRGSDERWITALLGGGNRAFAAHLASALRTALPDIGGSMISNASRRRCAACIPPIPSTARAIEACR